MSPLTAIKNLDLAVLALALPVFALAGWPLAGYATAAVAWLAQKAIKAYAERRAGASQDPRAVVGIIAGSMIGRGWLSALTIFAGWGLSGSDDAVGLSAAVLLIVLFTAYFTVSMILRPFETHREQPSS
jgi:hypothetical protein